MKLIKINSVRWGLFELKCGLNKRFKDYKIITSTNKSKSLFIDALKSNFIEKHINPNFICLRLRSNISAILSYQSTGC